MIPVGWTAWTVTGKDYDKVGPTHLAADDGRVTFCGTPLRDHWVSAPPGLFFKQRVMKPEYEPLCPDCLRVSGGKGPIQR